MHPIGARLGGLKISWQDLEARSKHARLGTTPHLEPRADTDWCRMTLCTEPRELSGKCGGYCRDHAKDLCHHPGCLRWLGGGKPWRQPLCSQHVLELGEPLPSVAPTEQLSEEDQLQAYAEESIVESMRSPTPERAAGDAAYAESGCV